MDASPVMEGRPTDLVAFRRTLLERLTYAVGKTPGTATNRDWFHAVALAVREYATDNWMQTTNGYYVRDQKRVYYLSLEFLIGRLLASALHNLGLYRTCQQALDEFQVDLSNVLEAEPDAALGNGGLGRLAACFMDSMATEGIAAHGYGIRYEFGLFEQGFDQGWQVEFPEDWLRFGNPWEFERPEVAYPVRFHGTVRDTVDHDNHPRATWADTEKVLAIAYDTPVVGWGGKSINTLRLWSAKATRKLNLEDFNRGEYMGAVHQRVLSENLSRVLYPNDATPVGQELRFKQEYFFTSASLQDILRRFRQHHADWGELPDRAAIQLNDTHPAIAVAELMRLLVDEHNVRWDKAWDIVQHTINYTNHTLMPEALETWPVWLVERVLPRHLRIIYDINARFLQRVRTRGPVTDAKLSSLSLIAEGRERRVRMSHLAFVGSNKVNGVSALHTELMKKTVFRDLHNEFPSKIVNMTNGITPRRWLQQCNRPLAGLITEAIGDGWVRDLSRLEALVPLAEDKGFCAAFSHAKLENKRNLADRLGAGQGYSLDTDALFDVQVKRFHEYKRQLLNILETAALYQAIREDPNGPWVPRAKFFGGKAAPGYHTAKMIIKLINDIARTVNADPEVRGVLKVVQLPNYNVTLAERLIPAAELSEQISTAGMEASGTGNMKFALNGALTIGTLDGANVEIREQVGPENIFIFGKTADQAADLLSKGYDARATVADTPRLARVLDFIAGGAFSPEDTRRFRGLVDGLLANDRFLVTADFAAYWDTQRKVDKAYCDQASWQRMAVLNTAQMGFFSSDRTVRSYAKTIWTAEPPLVK
ncbi:MAG: glycogen/starch/alpha-glucan phosphorylase [Rhodospirillaceae bacterium]|nr:glycogen/starch/alpha-glucan phosphorylase [Rhodospirillaceae bacterium]